ncbi:MAG: hypothetical protein IPL19_18995 [Sandaracinaceae bacterium]|nr:hypothetical protein [Sandaracinaceae bacterium]
MRPAPRPGEGSRFVTVADGMFCQPGPAATPFVPRGVGSYPLLDHVARGRLSHVHDIFDQALALGRPLIRTHAFFESGDSPGRLRSADGTFHEPGFRALDTVLALAAERGISLLLPVANNWADYGGAPPWCAWRPPTARTRTPSSTTRAASARSPSSSATWSPG